MRERLARLLCAEGFEVYPEDLRPAQGRERSDWRLDIQRWNGHGRVTDGRYGLAPGFGVQFDSWDTMTDCVRRGIVLDRDSRSSAGVFDVSAKEPQP